ncbi:MAG: LptF/LptG family permease [Verrucomicrobia bacterium]|nr:LptF/LptG family permease [Verrucomicrobiota bacterium]
MSILQRYIARQVLFTLVVAVAVFSAILLTGNALKQLLELLSTKQVPAGAVLQQLLYLVPFVMTFSLPMGMMTACLLVFSRLSADNEISAMRACGQSFWQLIAPVLAASFLLSLVCLYFNLQQAPLLKAAFKQGLSHLGLSHPTALLEPGRFNDDFPGYLIYVSSSDGERIRDVSIYQLDTRGNVIQKIRATHGELHPDLARKHIVITLHNVKNEVHDPNDPNNPQRIRPGVIAADYQLTMDIAPMIEAKRVRRDTNHLTFTELVAAIVHLKQRGVNPSPYVVRAHRQWATSFSCLAFAMIAIPFGIRSQRRETSIGIAWSLALAFGYYFLIIVGEALANKPQFYPEVIIWLPNFIFQALGILLLSRISRVGVV